MRICCWKLSSCKVHYAGVRCQQFENGLEHWPKSEVLRYTNTKSYWLFGNHSQRSFSLLWFTIKAVFYLLILSFNQNQYILLYIFSTTEWAKWFLKLAKVDALLKHISWELRWARKKLLLLYPWRKWPPILPYQRMRVSNQSFWYEVLWSLM